MKIDFRLLLCTVLVCGLGVFPACTKGGNAPDDVGKKALLIILDGWGIGDKGKDDVISQMDTPYLDYLTANYPHSQLLASGEGNATCGDILISGGTVTAEGEHDAAGIGTGARGSVGSITVTNGVTQVTVKKALSSAPHSIGGGADYTRIGTVTVGGKVGPVSESPFVYKP